MHQQSVVLVPVPRRVLLLNVERIGNIVAIWNLLDLQMPGVVEQFECQRTHGRYADADHNTVIESVTELHHVTVVVGRVFSGSFALQVRVERFNVYGWHEQPVLCEHVVTSLLERDCWIRLLAYCVYVWYAWVWYPWVDLF